MMQMSYLERIIEISIANPLHTASQVSFQEFKTRMHELYNEQSDYYKEKIQRYQSALNKAKAN